MDQPNDWKYCQSDHTSTSDCPSPGYTNLRTHHSQTWDLELDSALLFLSMQVSIDVLRHFLQTVVQTAYPPLRGPIPQGLNAVRTASLWVDVTLQKHRRMPKETNQSKK